MSRTRVCLLQSLPKLCSAANSQDSIRILPLLRNLSTDIEASYFQHPTEHKAENSFENHQNPNGYHGESQNPSESSRGNTNGIFRGGSSEDPLRLNHNGNHRGNPRNVFLGRPVGQTTNFGGDCGQLHDKNLNGSYQYYSGVYKDNYKWESQNNSAKKNGKFSEYSRLHNEELQQNPSAVNVNTSKDFQPSYNEFYQKKTEVYGNNPQNDFCNNTSVEHGKFSEHLRNDSWEFLQNYNGETSQNSRVVQHDWNRVDGANENIQNQYEAFQEGPAEVRQHTGRSYSQGFLKSNGSLHGSYAHNTRQSWQSSNYVENVVKHQNPSAGQYLQNQNVEEYKPNSNVLPNRAMNSQVLSNSKPGGELIEASEVISYRGSLEELDRFCKEGKVNEAVEVLGLLEKQSIPVDLVRCLHLLEACGDVQGLKEGKIVHKYIIRSVSPLDVRTYNKILKMYSKCGSMDYAVMVFKQMPDRNLTSWNTMLKGLVQNSLAEDALDLFIQFKETRLKPDDQMFISVFSACTVLGEVDEGLLHFGSMSKEFCIIPSMEHYVSVVNLLGSTGYLDEALEFIENMSLEPTVDVWETLMNLCRVHGHVDLGDRCAAIVEKLDPSRLNNESKVGLVPVKVSDLVKDKEKKRLAAENLLEARSRIHEYRAGDKSDPESDQIYAQLKGLKEQMKEAGYVPQTRFVLHDIDQESKEEALLSHSERLAVSYGLISSSARSPIRVIKNLRVCVDCHEALKIISKIVGRELVMRDIKRFHHFKDGVCSCKDYW